MIALHREIPTLALPDRTGRTVSTWEYKQTHPLVLVFGADSPLLADFAAHHHEYRAANAEVIAVVPSAPPERAPFPVLIDADGSATARYVDRTPIVLVTDAFGVLEGRFDDERPNHQRILNLISSLELACPECGAPAWPPEEES